MKAGFVGLIGLPNAGKSTLVNVLLGQKVAIVSRRPQTTRKRQLGIVTQDSCQAVFVDAPGIVPAKSGLNEFISSEWQAVMRESDVLFAILNLDEKQPRPLVRVLETVRKAGKPWAVVMTKSDLGSSDRIGFLKAELLQDGVPVIVVSAVADPKTTFEEVMALADSLLPESPALFDSELVTTENVRDMAGEIVREKCFEELGQEIPYGLAVKIRGFDEQDKITKIIADVIVDKASHRPMVIGQGGQKIKAIGTAARIDIEKLLEQKVFLELHVVIKEKWTRSSGMMKEFGYAQE